jgi:transcriptional regulator with XRE-family HTH domain
MELDLPNENFVAAWRERRGLTQEQLADKAGTTGSVISLLEAGKRQLSAKWLRRLASALDIPLGYLLETHPDDVPDDVLDAWARIPDAQKPAALAMLRSLAKAS